MTKDWSEYLWAEYMCGRNSPGWETLVSLHDDEDKQYFEMLKKSKIKPEPFPNDGRRLNEWAAKPVFQ